MRPTLTARGEVRFDGATGFLEEYDRNLRAGGLEVQSEMPLQLRESVRLRFLLPSTDEPLDVDAEVVFLQGNLAALQLNPTLEVTRRLAQEAMTHVTGRPPTGSWPTTPPPKPEEKDASGLYQSTPAPAGPDADPAHPDDIYQIVPPIAPAPTESHPLESPRAAAAPPPIAPSRTPPAIAAFRPTMPMPSHALGAPPPAPPAVSQLPAPGHPRGGRPAAVTSELKVLAEQRSAITAFAGRVTRPFKLGDLDEALHEGSTLEVDANDTTILRLLRMLSARQVSGTLHVQGPSSTKVLYILGGVPVYARSEPPREVEQVGRLLVDLGRMSERQRVEALERARQSGRRVGSVLVEMGVMRSDQLESLLRYQVEVRTLDLFSWPHAGYEFQPGRDPNAEAEAHPVRIRQLLVKQAHRFLKERSQAELVEALGPDQHRYVRLPGGALALEHLLPDLKQARALLPLLDGARVGKDIVAASSIGRLPTLRLLVLLRAAGAIEFAQTGSAVAAKDTTLELRERVATMERQNFFDRLGVHYTGHSREVRPGYQKALAELERLGASDAVLAKRGRDLLDEAHRTLADVAARRRYRSQTVGEDRVAFAADLLLRQAQLLAMKGEGARVREILDVVDEMRPSREAQALRAKLDAGR